MDKVVTSTLEVGEIVKQVRKDAGVTQVQASSMCGVGARFLRELENGKPTLEVGKVLQVLKGFGITITLNEERRNQ